MTFDEMFYLQIQGIAIGTIFALTYATLSIGFHEIELCAIIRNKFTLPVSNYFEQNWKRFLDDCFIKFKKTKRIAGCSKQYQTSYTICYGNR